MTHIKRKWDLITKERRDTLVKEIITFFATKRDEEIGILAAEEILDFFLEALYGDIHNKAIDDAKVITKQTFENLEIDLDTLLNK
jgi:uncharacterized protein (DUF2164 family)